MDDWLKDVKNETVLKAALKSKAILARHSRIAVSISGGADSDVLLDLVERTKGNRNVRYIWFNTGLEYQATKDHLVYLENRYQIEIERIRAEKPVPYCVHEYGVPFKSKFVSEMLGRFQDNDFCFEDRPFDELLKEYPNCREALRWWCNDHVMNTDYPSRFNISRNPWLKEFLIANPPPFKVSNNCCTYAKKEVSHRFTNENNIDLNVIGVRQAEGGVRAATKTCFSEGEHSDTFRPIFWFTDEDKRYYDETFGIVHSDCYTKYGLKRTGCVGCPYGKNIEEELAATKENEPRLYKACWNVFGEAYEYTRAFNSFRREMNDKKKNPDQTTMFELGMI